MVIPIGIRTLILKRPLLALTLIGLVPRLIAAFFSGGYFAHDDHFLVIEAAGSWVDGSDYNYWLPWNQPQGATPSGHSFFYVGIHFLLFWALKWIGITDPKAMMVVIRLLHAIWSLIVIRCGYLIALRLSDREIAWRTGLFLALFYFMPFLSVRNLVEVACIPFLMLAAWELVRSDRPDLRAALIAGIWIGLAINIRFQTIFFAAGPGLALLFKREWRSAIFYGFGVIVPLVVIQGGLDLFLWKRPFAEITEYIRYNLENTETYGTLPWYNYLLLLAGIFIPPFSILLLFGYFRRTTPLVLWLPLLLFLAIHSYFPNKQERFLLPMIPLFFVIAYSSWEQFRLRSPWWLQRHGMWRGIMIFTWVLNSIVLLVLCFSYSKRSRVEALYSLRNEDVRGLIIEDSVEGDAPMPPLFYMQQWNVEVIPITSSDHRLDTLIAKLPPERIPDHVLFFGEEQLQERSDRMAAVLGDLQNIDRAEPGLVDKVVHWLNPVNRNETIIIARVERSASP